MIYLIIMAGGIILFVLVIIFGAAVIVSGEAHRNEARWQREEERKKP